MRGRSVDEPSALPVSVLIETVVALKRAEAKAAGVVLQISAVDSDLAIFGQEVELAQAIVNLVRNAVQACDGLVTLSALGGGDHAVVTVTNRCLERRPPQSGMGVGALVARAIVEPHGGTLRRATHSDGIVRANLTLPRVGAAARPCPR